MASNSAEYQRNYRNSNQAYRDRQRRLDKIRAEARRELAELHPEDYNRILARIKLREGIE